MSESLWFIVPAHGRLEKTRVCLRQLRRTCEQITNLDVRVVVIADDENLVAAREAGFHTMRQENRPLGRKWNDGYHQAGLHGADYVVPFGSDDWVDPVLFTDLPGPTEIRCSRLSSVVSEDGRRISPIKVWYDGGDGVRILPRNLLERCGWRPAEEGRDRAIDTSIMQRLQGLHGGALPPIRYFDAHPYQIVDWKTAGDQLNTYDACVAFRHEPERDTWETLKDRYPVEALEEMREVYGL